MFHDLFWLSRGCLNRIFSPLSRVFLSVAFAMAGLCWSSLTNELSVWFESVFGTKSLLFGSFIFVGFASIAIFNVSSYIYRLEGLPFLKWVDFLSGVLFAWFAFSLLAVVSRFFVERNVFMVDSIGLSVLGAVLLIMMKPWVYLKKFAQQEKEAICQEQSKKLLDKKFNPGKVKQHKVL